MKMLLIEAFQWGVLIAIVVYAGWSIFKILFRDDPEIGL